MKIQYFIRHPEFDGHIRVSRSEYNLLKPKAGSKSTGFEAYADSYPDLPVASTTLTDHPKFVEVTRIRLQIINET